MLKHFRLWPFVAGLAVGYLMLVFYKAPAQVIHDYPHPEAVKNRVYRDANGVCYKYNAASVGCNANEATLKPYPLQAAAN